MKRQVKPVRLGNKKRSNPIAKSQNVLHLGASAKARKTEINLNPQICNADLDDLSELESALQANTNALEGI